MIILLAAHGLRDEAEAIASRHGVEVDELVEHEPARVELYASLRSLGWSERNIERVLGPAPDARPVAPAVPAELRDAVRSRRKREVAGRTIAVNRITKRERTVERELEAQRERFLPVAHLRRPATRAGCEAVERPCPFVSCRYHLYLDVHPRTGAIKLNFPDLEPDQLPELGSCVLDVAEREGSTLEHVAEVMNITRERVRQIETKAFRRLQETGAAEALEESA